MSRYTTTEALLAALPAEPPLAYAIGALPRAPRDAVVWIKPITLDQAIRVHVMEVERHRKQPAKTTSFADRQRLVLQRCLFRNPEQWRLNGIEQPSCDTDTLVPLFDGIAAMTVLGDPTMDGTCAQGFLTALLEASGWPEKAIAVGQEEEGEEPQDFDAWIAESAGDGGQWLPDLWPDGEVYVRPFDESQRDFAQMHGYCNDLGLSVEVPWRSTPYLVSSCILSGPGGSPLLTQQQARALPLGLAQACAWSAGQLVPRGGWGIKARFRASDTVDSAGGDAGLPPVVVGGEGGRVAQFPDGSVALAGQDVAGELHGDAAEGQRDSGEGV